MLFRSGRGVSGCVPADERVIAALEGFREIAPAHNPPYALGIQRFQEKLPSVPRVALFETAFYQWVPEAATRYAVPQAWHDAGVRRYGFHGASHKFVAERSAELLGRADVAERARRLYQDGPSPLSAAARPLRVISCHFGGSSSVTGIRDVHVVPAEERTRVYSRDSLFLDVGATSEAEVAAMGISPGDPVVPDAPFTVLNGTDNYLGKGWDDRVGCAVVVEAMRRLSTAAHPNQLIWTITTQEEVGLRGAESAAATIKPDLAIAIEGGITGDVFGGRPEETQVQIGRAHV